MKVLFTEKALRALKPKAYVYRVRDGIADPALRGFGVTVSTSGTKSFFLGFTSPESGQRKQGTLGIYPALTLAKAREQARQWRQQIREGVDPVLEAKRRQQAAQEAHKAEEKAEREERELGTVEQLFDLYVRDMDQDAKRSAEFVRRIYANDIGPAIGEKKARDVTAEHCADIIATVAERGALTLANRARSYLVSAFNFGMRAPNMPRWRGKAPRFGIGSNPAITTEKALQHEPRGQRHLSREEVRRVWGALSESYEVIDGRGVRRMARVDASTEIALKLLIGTGQRTEEVLHATWDEFDLEQQLWTIHAKRRKNARKNVSGEPHLVPLANLHIELLQALEPYSEGSRFLFPARGGAAPRKYYALTHAVYRLCERTGIERFSPRDIRRTWKTLAGSIGIDLEIRNRIQGHGMSDVGSLHYDRHSYLIEKREAMQRWTAALERWIGEESNVIPLRRAESVDSA